MKKVNGGIIRALGYDAKRGALAVELSSGTFEYANVSAEIFRRFSTASSLSSFYRDNIEEEFARRRIK